ncbi:MAG: Mth938-like domain-containing protein [Thiothrix sp.]
MKFSEEFNSTAYRISGYGVYWVQVNQQRLTSSFLISSDTLITTWPPQSFATLETQHLDALFNIGAEVILIGTGKRQQLPSPAVWQALVNNGAGFEIMTTDAVCRTYNVLLAEARRVAAAIFLN